MLDRSRDWLRQAERDLEAAKLSFNGGIYEWACFLSQQCAEKAVKALCERLRVKCWGHSVSKTLGFTLDRLL